MRSVTHITLTCHESRVVRIASALLSITVYAAYWRTAYFEASAYFQIRLEAAFSCEGKCVWLGGAVVHLWLCLSAPQKIQHARKSVGNVYVMGVLGRADS